MSPAASVLRGGDIDRSLELIDKHGADNSKYNPLSKIKNAEELESIKTICELLKKFINYELRVEQPWISVYTNTIKDVKLLEKIFDDSVIRYISKPVKANTLTEDTVVMPKMDYDFKITLAATKKEHSAFVEWAESNKKLRVTKSCKRELLRNRSWGGTHFYVTGDNNLLMAKMHLGGSIAKIQRIVKE